ncbi:cell cycle checkpoint protein RAD17 isoform X3 [Pundamilia nyererei]|nr:PREDICTED: cell cycle checkpoint protein RAD17 isoform X3 [Pundamilia nyererei]XP_005733694.1 PREDICTED: cell cycle checkpoint protein RAD17 isoform X3 [Pundamilia nyererei]
MNKLVADKATERRANHWVDPSFIDLREECSSLSGRRNGNPVLCSKAEIKRKRKREASVSYLLKESSQLDQNEPWVDKYSPRSQAELAVHKKKMEEVEKWIRVHTNTKSGILLLTGPSGCGKTATVRVLSLEMGLRVQEWSSPTNLEAYSSSHEWRTNGFSSSSQSSQFQDFLLRANKYNCLKMAGDGGVAHNKLILVEDLPNQFYRQPGALHEILRRFVRTSQCPLVFIVSDSLSGDGSSRFLFPKDIQEELGISSISFNPVAPTAMMKVLTCIATQEAAKSCRSMCVPDQTLLETLCSGSSGDIRSAINSLQFSCLPTDSCTSLETGLWRTKKDRSLCRAGSTTSQRKKKSKQEEALAIGGKDASLFLFRALGKILHCKREKHEGADGAEGGCGRGLPSHLLHHHRAALLVDPELVVERSHMSGEFFSLYLHQNYLDFFCEVEDVERASEYLSDADLLTADWTNRSVLGDYGSSVATRGLLHSNSQLASVGFRALHKPSWLLVNRKHWENCVAAQSLFRSFCLTPLSLQTELLPYLAKLTNPMRNQDQITFIQDVGQMSLRRFSSRLKPEALTDKESGELEIDSEVEEKEEVKEAGGAEEGLPASQPQPTLNQVLLEDEDLTIEEYISD